MTEKDEPFLSRWSRLKREAAAETRTEEDSHERDDAVREQPAGTGPADASSQPLAERCPEEPGLDVEKIDLDKLDATSDYKPFMSPDVPDEIRNKALSKLWLSDPVLAGPEQLSDYMEDFSDAACAVPGGLLRTAYRVGRGFLNDEELEEWRRLGREEKAAPSPVSASVVVRQESPDQPDAAALLAASDAYAQSLYPPESNHLVDLESLMAPNAMFFVARQDGNALGCGALIIADGGWGEVKRMWVAPEARGQGIGRRLLAEIEGAARERELASLKLETGVKQAEAIGMYRRCGFSECDPFGDYKPDPLSVFMEKALT